MGVYSVKRRHYGVHLGSVILHGVRRLIRSRIGVKQRDHAGAAASAKDELMVDLSESAVKPRHHCGPYIVGRMAYGPSGRGYQAPWPWRVFGYHSRHVSRHQDPSLPQLPGDEVLLCGIGVEANFCGAEHIDSIDSIVNITPYNDWLGERVMRIEFVEIGNLRKRPSSRFIF